MEFLWLVQAEVMFQLLEANVIRRATLAQDITDAQIIQCEEVGIPFVSTRAYCAIATLSYYIVHTSALLSKLSVLLLLVVGVQTNRAVSVNTGTAQRLIFIIVHIKPVHFVLHVVEVVEQDPDGAAGDERGNSQTAEHPHDRGIVQERVERLGDGGSEGVGEQVHGLDEGLHAGRRLGVGVLETGDRGENLRDTDEHVGSGLGGNVDVVALGDAVDLAGLAERVAVAWSGFVDVMLDDGGVDHGERSNPETSGDTVDGREVDPVLAEKGEEPLIHKRQEDDDGNGVEVLHQIVGDTVTSHLTSLGDEVVGEVAVYDPVDGVEAEDLAGNKSTLDLLNEVVVPESGGLLSKSGLVRWLCGVHAASLDHLAHDTESVGDNRALRRANDVDLATENENERTDEEDAQAQQVGGPEVGIALHVRSGEQGQGADVDAPVEDHVDTRDGDRGVDDDALASLLVGTNNHLATLVLIGNQGSDVGLDTTSSETNDDDSSNETTKTSASLKGNRYRSQGEDKETNDVNTAEDDDSVVLSEVLISNDSTENRCNIAPELEEGGKTSGSLVSHTESTTSLTTIERALDVVLEDTGGTVVGETFAKFDDSDQEGSLGERLANLTQSSELLLCGPDTTKAIVNLGVANRSARADGYGLLYEVLLCDAGSCDIVVVQRQAVQVWVLVSLGLLVLQLVGTERWLAHSLVCVAEQNIRCFLCGSHGWGMRYNQRSDDQWKNRANSKRPDT
jgi:hypothetical protein